MKNIKQYTNLSPATIEEDVEVSIKTPTGNKTFFIDYKVITIENTKIIKLGYCCGDGLFQCPIIINDKQITIGKTGMLEYQEEPINGELVILDNFEKGGIFKFPYQLKRIKDEENLPPEKQIYFTQTFDYTIETS